MSALILLTAALAAQAASATGAGVPPDRSERSDRSDRSDGAGVGQSNYVDLEGGAGYSTNPRMSFESGNGGGFGRISLHAVHSRVSARSTTLLSGYASNSSYTNHISSQQSLSFDARHDMAISEQVRVFGDFNASFDKGGQLDTRIIGVPNVPPAPGSPDTPPVLLPPGSDFLSVTGRVYRITGHGGAQMALNERDSLTVRSGVERVVFRGGSTDSDYTTVPVAVSFDRRLSERATVGAQLSAEYTDYSGPSSSRLLTPQVTGRLALTERMSLGGAVGMSFGWIDDGTDTRHTHGIAANADLCQRSERGMFCARASVDQEAVTTAGPAKSVSVGLDYSHRLDADSTVQFSLGANRYSSPISVISGRTFSRSTYYRAAADYTRRIGDRLFGGVNLAARKLAEDGPDPKADVNASLFVRYRFGDVQ